MAVQQQPMSTAGMGQPVVVMGQPMGMGMMGMQWMTLGAVPPNCPDGLEWLVGQDTLFVRQAVNMLDVMVGWREANRYDIFNPYGQRVYLALEKSDECERQCCGPSRGFEMALMDATGKAGIFLDRPFVCQCCCALCCVHEVTVRGGGKAKTKYGTVRQVYGCNEANFEILDASGTRILTIDGPCIICDIAETFYLKTADGKTQLGRISKQWSGFIKEMFTNADNYGISFPNDLEVKAKATVLGACLLIDFLFYERHQQNRGYYGGYGYGGYGYGYGRGYY